MRLHYKKIKMFWFIQWVLLSFEKRKLCCRTRYFSLSTCFVCSSFVFLCTSELCTTVGFSGFLFFLNVPSHYFHYFSVWVTRVFSTLKFSPAPVKNMMPTTKRGTFNKLHSCPIQIPHENKAQQRFQLTQLRDKRWQVSCQNTRGWVQGCCDKIQIIAISSARRVPIWRLRWWRELTRHTFLPEQSFLI